MNKKLLALTLASLMLTSSAAYASADKKVTHDLDVAPQKIEAPQINSSDEVSIQAGLSVPLYSQSGQTWSSSIMQSCGSTINSAGCTLTSVAMVFKYYGVSIDPGQLNTKMGASACPLVYNDAVTKAGAGIVKSVSVTSPTAWSTVYSEARTAINAGKPYILGFRRADSSTHFVVIKGYVNSGTVASDFSINDPAGGVTRSLSYYGSHTPYRGAVYSK